MAVTAYNDWLSDLSRNVECVLAFDTAADFLGLTDGGYRSLVQIFVDKRQKIEGTEQILVPSLDMLECEERNGLEIPGYLQSRFDKYKVWALEYYEE